jgi:hypothetical protein
MASQRRVLRHWNDITLIEENVYILIPYLTIETAYIVTSEHMTDGAYFNDLCAATKAFEAEVARSAVKPSHPSVMRTSFT